MTERQSPWAATEDAVVLNVYDRLTKANSHQATWPLGVLVMRGVIDAKEAYELMRKSDE